MTTGAAKELADAINAYHAIVRSVPPRERGPWGFFRYFFWSRHAVGPHHWSLWRFEKEIRRFGDPRIHFALNCGAASCPPIREYEAERLDQQLTLATRSYLATEQAFRLDEAARTVWLSPLFRWYRGDFGPPLDFIAPYLAPDQQARLARVRGACRTRYLPWDWSLAP